MEYTETYHVKDDAIFKDYVQKKKSLSEHSIRAYRNSLNKLCKATEETLYNIVQICKKEQKPRIEEDNSITIFSPNDFDSSINIYLGQFLEYCEAVGNKNTTINDNMRAIRTFFNFYEVKLPNWKPLDDDSEDWYLLNKEDIRFVLNDSTIVHSAIITFLLSTGMREEDACSLTVGDFMEATSSYHDYVDVEEFIDNAPNDMKGYWSFEPHKTQRYKIECKTFNSPESSNYILQSLRKIKNEYIPNKNKKDGLNLKITKKSALFGSRNRFYLDSLAPQSVTDTFTRKNVKLREWNISQIDLKIKNKDISEEDREENIKKIPKFHPHGLRKYFCTAVHKYGDVRTCLVLEGHRSKISTDKSYVKISKDDVEKVYNKALADLSIAPTEAKIITDSEAEELREEVKSLNRKLEEKDKEIEVLEISNEELRKQTLAQETRQQEIEERLVNVENSFPELHNILTRQLPDGVQNIELKAIVMDFIDTYKEEDSPKVIAKKIKTLKDEDLFALKEITCDLAKGEEKQPQTVEEIDSLIAKAVLLMEIKPDLKDKIIQDYENNSDGRPLTKFYEILKDKLESMELGEEKVVEKLCQEITNNFIPIFLESPMEEITEELVMNEIEKYLFKNMT